MPDARPVKLLRKRLDAAGVLAHLRALAASARDLEIRTKEEVAVHSNAAADGLDVVGRKLIAGELAAVQVRYFQDDGWWTDTLMHASDGSFRIVRMRQSSTE